ncbi:hypothetical protein SAMN05444008_10933 [Cnuella takakiae]|uniref:Uncharacterized protein n=1 Tax=Cnuella takakiae TaxID=1302690 RepID=A0A1M5CE91_9BACT|nr:hypothetical protein [Cnuella takakiae]OLY91785.1 hypothetical protein BUE76_07650 [Cnuella takakiae]SHF53058.1 hypothetical protein SAMN05444008_10933 [Cnuella takakiae]
MKLLFQFETAGRTILVEYDETTRKIKPRAQDGQPIPAIFPRTDGNYVENKEVTRFCLGADLVIIFPRTNYPYAVQSIVPNSSQCAVAQPLPASIPAIEWVNKDQPQPFVDSNLFLDVDGVRKLESYISEAGTMDAPAGSTITVQQPIFEGLPGFYWLAVTDLTTETVLYKATSNVSSYPAIPNTFTFIIQEGHRYRIEAVASEFGNIVPPTSPNAPERLIYRLQWRNFEETLQTVDIIDTSEKNPTAVDKIIPLDGAGNAFSVSIVDNEESPFTPIRAKEAIIRFLGSEEVNLSNFGEGEDNRWYVVHYTNNVQVPTFQGFLTFSDAMEPFLPYPNEVQLVATDGLGLLKDVPLTDKAGKNPKGTFTLIQYVAWALQKTGLELGINLVHNLWEENNPGLPMYATTYLDAKTFEDEVGTSISCYEVLQRILGEDAFLQFNGGKWWIVRPDELQGGTYKVWKFDSAGALIPSILTPNPEMIEPVKLLGFDEKVSWINEQQNVIYNRPHREVKEVFNYEFHKELVDNINFSRGAMIIPMGGQDWKAYQVEDWTMKAGFAHSPNTITSQAYIKRVFFEGYEKERYLVFTPQTNQVPNSNHIESNPIPIEAKDRFTASIDYKLKQTGSNYGQSVFVMTVRLAGNDGTFWWLGRVNDKETWVQAGDNWGSQSATAQTFVDYTDPDWATLTWKAPASPVGGLVYLTLHTLNVRPDFSQDNTDVFYQNLRFTYDPYINGGYAEYSGQYNRVFQGGKYQSKHEQQVYVSDSPRKLFKGALLRKDGTGKYLLAGKFTHPAYPGFKQPFGWWQAMAVWYAKRRVLCLFEGDTDGLNLPAPGDCIHQWQITDITAQTKGKTFMLLHYDMNFTDCSGQVVLHEISDNAHPKTFTGPHEFRYLERR